MRKPVRLAMLVLAAVLAASCGARVSESQITAAGGPGGAGQFSTGGASQVGDSQAQGGAADQTVTGGPGTQSGEQAGQQGGTEQSQTAPGDNGGATDVGVTATEILLGNISTLSGPVPGLFAGAVTGAQAAVAYQNSKGGIHGRRLKLEVRDDQFDTGQNRAHTVGQLNRVFAFLNSFSLYDDAAVAEVEKSGIPDVSVPINDSRSKIANNVSVAPIDNTGGPTGSFEWFKEKFPEAVTAVGTLYGDVPASKAQHQRMRRTAEAVGWKFVYERGYTPTETDYTADVVRMRQAGVKAVWLFAVDAKNVARIAKAMVQQGFEPQFANSNYEATTPELAGEALEGWYGTSTQSLYASPDEAAINPEVKLFQEWVQKVKPGVTPDLYGIYGWAMGKLLFQAMEAAGPKLTRARVLEEIRKIGEFSAGDTIAPANPGAKIPAKCFILAQVKDGDYRRAHPAKGFDCRGTYLKT